MINEEQQEPESIFSNEPDPVLQGTILNTSKWMRLISVAGFAMGAFVVMMMIVGGAAIMSELVATFPVKVPGLYGALVLVFFILFFVAAGLLYFLYRAANLLRQGVVNNDDMATGEGFSALYKFLIILLIIGILSLTGNISQLIR